MSLSDAKQTSEVGALGVQAPPRIMGLGADPEPVAKAEAPPKVEAEVAAAALVAPLSQLCHLKSVTITIEVNFYEKVNLSLPALIKEQLSVHKSFTALCYLYPTFIQKCK